jgi:hypothetical protein
MQSAGPDGWAGAATDPFFESELMIGQQKLGIYKKKNTLYIEFYTAR